MLFIVCIDNTAAILTKNSKEKNSFYRINLYLFYLMKSKFLLFKNQFH